MTYYIQVKRLIDFIAAILLIVLLLPLYMIISLIILINMGRPILFIQERPGLRDKPFHIIKFRTMNDVRGQGENHLSDRMRLTKVGVFLRKASLDELPELINVLKGDMSLVGPRPLFSKYLPFYTERERLRHSVRPGITGLAQISGRNLLGWKERLEKDVEYVENMSFYLDGKILIKTVLRVILQKGIYLNIIEDLDEYRKQPVLSSLNENSSS